MVYSGGCSKCAYQIGFTKALLQYIDRKEIKSISGASMGLFNAYALSSGKLDDIEFMFRNINIKRKRELFWEVFGKNLLLREIDGLFSGRDTLEIPVYFPICYFPIFSVRYYELLGEYNPLWKEYATAAANFPFLKVIPNVLNKRFAIDGGAVDNIPLFPIIKSGLMESDGGYDLIIVLHFDARYEYRKEFVTDVPIIDLDVSYGNEFSKNHLDFSSVYVGEMIDKGYEYGDSICKTIFEGDLSRKSLKRKADEIFLKEHEARQRHKSADGLVSVLNVIGKFLRNDSRNIQKLY